MKKIILGLFSLMMSLNIYAQISEGGRPQSFQLNFNEKLDVNYDQTTVTLPQPELHYIQLEDAENDEKGKPYRVGVNIGVNYNPYNSGVWSTLANGDVFWRISFKVNEALALGLYFSEEVVIPNGAKLFAYNSNKKQVLGAYTANTPRFQAMEMVEGDLLTLEYYAPSGTIEQPKILISDIAYFYRGIEDHIESYRDIVLPKAASCQVDVACIPERNGWEDQIRSVVHYTFNVGSFQYVCSASTVNNTALDCKPYILTAWHCGEPNAGSNISSWVWYWNYQKTSCQPSQNSSNPSTGSQTMTGGTVRASSGNGTLNNPPGNNQVAGSDFYLVELNSNIPASYNPFYAGWNRTNTAATSGVGIHHPAGSAKKISTFTSSLNGNNISFNGGGSGHFWRVVWAATTNGHGVTEGGSSGSPIFNQNGLIVGQLTGGSSFCNSPTQPDLYGKMWSNWDQNGSVNSARLGSWLDPVNSGVTFLSGTNAPCSPQPPVADFVANQTTVAPGTTVNFTDLSSNSPISWTWSVSPGAGWTYAGGTNANSQNPQITFNTLGQYTVSLLASNAEGSDTETKTNYINVVESTGPCAAASTNNPACDEYISNVTLQGINNTTGCTTYSDFTSQSTNLTKGEQYTVTVIPRILGNTDPIAAYPNDEIAVWIDFNNDGVFNNTTERVGYVLIASGVSLQFPFTVPVGAVTGPVRMRCRLSYQPTDGPIDPCGTSAWGEVEDYIVNIQEPAGSTSVTINCGVTTQTINQSESTVVPNFVPGATASTTCAGGATSITQSPAAGSQLNPGNNTITLTATDNCGNSSSCTINVTLVNNLSINEYLKESVTVYPNPTSGNVFIDLSKTGLTEFSVSLVDLSGKILSFDEVSQAEVYELDMTDFASGLYQVVVQAGDGLFVAKVAKN